MQREAEIVYHVSLTFDARFAKKAAVMWPMIRKSRAAVSFAAAFERAITETGPTLSRDHQPPSISLLASHVAFAPTCSSCS